MSIIELSQEIKALAEQKKTHASTSPEYKELDTRRKKLMAELRALKKANGDAVSTVSESRVFFDEEAPQVIDPVFEADFKNPELETKPSFEKQFKVPKTELILSIRRLEKINGFKPEPLDSKSVDELEALRESLGTQAKRMLTNTTDTLTNFYIMAMGGIADAANPYCRSEFKFEFHDFYKRLHEHKDEIKRCIEIEFEKSPEVGIMVAKYLSGFAGLAITTVGTALSCVREVPEEKKE
jgi:hypothetical protein